MKIGEFLNMYLPFGPELTADLEGRPLAGVDLGRSENRCIELDAHLAGNLERRFDVLEIETERLERGAHGVPRDHRLLDIGRGHARGRG
jgi:hypothetical protein